MLKPMQVIIFSLLLYFADAVYVIDVYRMLQYENLGTSFGSQRATLNSLAVTVNNKADSLSRYIVVVPASQFTEELVDNMIERNADGILVVIPKNKNEIDLKKWKSLETTLLSKSLPLAVYFCFREQTVDQLYDEISRDETQISTSLLGTDSYRLEVRHPESAPFKDFRIFNIQGWIAGSAKDIDSAPTIAIVSYFDTMGIAPNLAYGVDSNGSGVIALLELARLFSKLYKGSKTQGKYNLLFLMGGAGRHNFAGTKSWLDTADAALLESVDFALCIDTIGTSKNLSLHVSRSTKDPKAAKIYEIFTSLAETYGIPFNVVHKKIVVGSNDVPWQHEQFSKKRVLSGTMSGESEPSAPMSRSNIFDTQINQDIMKRNIKFIAEGLARIVYNLDHSRNISIFSGEYAVSDVYTSSWANILSTVPRVTPYFTQKGDKEKTNNTFVSGLEKELSKFATDVSHKLVVLPQDEIKATFYDKTKVQMSAYRGKPVSFDVILTLLIFIYCSSLYTALMGTHNAYAQIQQIFFRETKKKR